MLGEVVSGWGWLWCVESATPSPTHAPLQVVLDGDGGRPQRVELGHNAVLGQLGEGVRGGRLRGQGNGAIR